MDGQADPKPKDARAASIHGVVSGIGSRLNIFAVPTIMGSSASG
jgi:hypothetical protein